jgi:hypothetical protein
MPSLKFRTIERFAADEGVVPSKIDSQDGREFKKKRIS